MVAKTRVFDGEHGVLHELRGVGDRQVVAPLGAELADLHPVVGEHPQRLARLVVGEHGQLGQLLVEHREHRSGEQRAAGGHATGDERDALEEGLAGWFHDRFFSVAGHYRKATFANLAPFL